jgi:hypothetical protein
MEASFLRSHPFGKREMIQTEHAAEAAEKKPKKKALGADTKATLPRGPRD